MANRNPYQGKGFIFGDPGASRRPFELNVKGRGKSRKRKTELASTVSLQAKKDEDVFIIDAESFNFKNRVFRGMNGNNTKYLFGNSEGS